MTFCVFWFMEAITHYFPDWVSFPDSSIINVTNVESRATNTCQENMHIINTPKS